MGFSGRQISASLVVLFHLIFRSIFHTHSIERMSSSDESGAELSRPSSATLPDKEKHTERILGRRGYREFLIVDHTANLRKNTKISAIWHHGEERRTFVISVSRRKQRAVPQGIPEIERGNSAGTIDGEIFGVHGLLFTPSVV